MSCNSYGKSRDVCIKDHNVPNRILVPPEVTSTAEFQRI